MTKSILIVGDSGVGKTSFVDKYCYNIFNKKHFATIAINESEKDSYKLYDYPGEDKYDFITNINEAKLNSINVAIVMYELNNKTSYKNVEMWTELVHELKKKIPIIIVGNKKDIYRQNRKVFNKSLEISVKNNYNIDILFREINKLIDNN